MAGTDADCVSNVYEFDDIEPPLALFVFGHEGLRPIELSGYFNLSQPGVFPALN
jgi:hypothetical protein